MNYESIITHNDFDGVASAAICSYIYKIDTIKFAGPNNIARSEITITERDIVCDLPYPLQCGLWFDHHEGNLHELKYRNIDPNSIPGKFDIQPSCARVVYENFRNDYSMPAFFDSLVNETDIIDSFDYSSVEDWRKATPAKIIDATIRSKRDRFSEKINYLKQLVQWFRNHSLEKITRFTEIVERYSLYQQEEKEMLNIISNNSFFSPLDNNKEIIIIDLTNFKHPQHIIKNLAYLLYPNALAVLEISPIFRNRIKTNDLSFSLSFSFNLNNDEHHKDAGEIMRELNIGDGHKGAAAGTVFCKSKEIKLKQKEFILSKIIDIWQEQN